MSIPLHSQIRKRLNGILNTILVKLFKPKDNFSKIDPKDINRILLVRINYRIGNILFMTPLIRALERKLPQTKVDVMVGAPFTVPLIKDLPNVKNVYATPRELTKNPIKLYKHIKEINKNRYDLIICPIVGSFSTNMATLLLKSDIKLGFYAPDIWVPINKAVKQPENLTHEALKPLRLMDIFEGEKPDYNRYLDIALTENERDEGKKIIEPLITKRENQTLIALFRDARGDKKIDKKWWMEFVDKMLENNKDMIFVDILPPNEKEPLLKDMPHISAKNLRDLAKIFSAFDLFICGDTGPMHLAGAVQTPTIALFNATDPTLYGPLGKQDIAIDIDSKDVSEVTKECYEHIKEKSL